MNSRNFRSLVGFLVVGFLFSFVMAQGGGSGWLPGWAGELGIELEKVPAPDESFLSVKGRIVDAEKAGALLGQVKIGDAVELKYAGNVAWTVETEVGKVRPCALKAFLEGSEKGVTLVPDSRTNKLRLGPPPFKGSTRATGKN